MDYQKALEKLEALRCLAEKDARGRGSLSFEEQSEISILYGECEPVITQIVGVQVIKVGATEVYSNMIEAGYLAGRTNHRYAGYQQLLKVIGRVRQLAEDPGLPQPAASISQLVRTLRRFRECCQYLQQPLANERAVQDVLWIMLRSQLDRLDREEMLPKFGAKSYKPDFGVPDLATLIEVKFIGEATRVQDIQEEILADVPGYLREATGYSSLIVFVYDAAQKLRDARRFVEDLRKVTGIIDVIVVPGVGA
jgi:hypothetical protein